jgi:metal transporter CNNM
METTNIIIIAVLVILSGIFSGLNLGLLSLNLDLLRRKISMNNKYAIRVYPLRKKGNLLLCTLLVGNAAVNAVLAVFLGSLTTGVIAIVAATGLIVTFGEILPQSFFAKHGLKWGARTAWFVELFMFLLYPICKPIAMMLDWSLGGELPNKFSRKEIRLFLRQQKHRAHDIAHHEFELLERGLVFSKKTVKDVMTPRTRTFFMSRDTLLDHEMLTKIRRQGHSRVPVYDKLHDKVVGLLYSKDLIEIDPDDDTPVWQIMRKKMDYIQDDDKLDKVLKLFQKKRVHLFIVRDKFKGMQGIITLEDVLEEIVGEIVDEYDVMVDMRAVHKRIKGKIKAKKTKTKRKKKRTQRKRARIKKR